MSNQTKKSRDYAKARQYLANVLSSAECYQSDSFDIGERINDMRNRFNLPQYEWSWLDGYRACRQDAWQYTSLVYCLIWQGTPVKMEWNTLTEEQKDYCRVTSYDDTNSGHYWLNKDGSIGRVYYSNATSAKYDVAHNKVTNNGLSNPHVARIAAQSSTMPVPA